MPKRDREAVSQGLSGILGSSEAADLLGSVIRSDRQRAGRTVAAPLPDPEGPNAMAKDEAAEIQANMTSHSVISEYDNKSVTQTGNKASGQTDKQDSVQADRQVSPIVIGQGDTASERGPSIASKREGKRKPERGAGDLLEGRLSEAKRMAESATTTVTLRLPRELNDWLDEYVHRAWPERVRKQELVIEGLRLLFARRGRPGEPIVETGLLPE